MRSHRLSYLLLLGTLLNQANADPGLKKPLPPCPDFGAILGEIQTQPVIWKHIADIYIRDTPISAKFENQTLKNFYENRTYSKEEYAKEFPRVEQAGCETATFTYANGAKAKMTVSDQTPYRLVFNVVEADANAPIAKDDAVVFKTRRIAGHKVLEQTIRKKYSITEECGGKPQAETHRVEVQSIVAWKKAVSPRRFVTDNLLRILHQNLRDTVTGISRRIASCEAASTEPAEAAESSSDEEPASARPVRLSPAQRR